MKVIWKDNGDGREVAKVGRYTLFVCNNCWLLDNGRDTLAEGSARSEEVAKECAEAVANVLTAS